MMEEFVRRLKEAIVENKKEKIRVIIRGNDGMIRDIIETPSAIEEWLTKNGSLCAYFRKVIIEAQDLGFTFEFEGCGFEFDSCDKIL